MENLSVKEFLLCLFFISLNIIKFLNSFFLFQINSVDLLDKRGYLTICLYLSKEGSKILLRKPEGIRDWHEALKVRKTHFISLYFNQIYRWRYKIIDHLARIKISFCFWNINEIIFWLKLLRQKNINSCKMMILMILLSCMERVFRNYSICFMCKFKMSNLIILIDFTW